jgi:large subunit ribosomal protein L11
VAKKVTAVLKLLLPAGKATPAYPVGPTLGPHGINIPAFVREYNERSASQAGYIVPAELTIYADRSFTFRLLTPPASDLLRQAAGVAKGSATPKRVIAGTITRKQLRQLAQLKLADTTALDIEGAERMLAGTARSMGIQIVD